MNIDNIAGEHITLNEQGKMTQISVYEKEINKLQQENKQLKEMIDEQDGCNKRRLQIFNLKDKLCKELKNVKNLKQENKQLKEKYLNAVSDYEQEKYKNSKAIEYLEQPNRDNFDFSKAILLNVLQGDSNE